MPDSKRNFPPEFSESLAHNLARVGHLIRQETAYSLQSLGLTPEQWQALVYLDTRHDDKPGLTQNELAGLLLRDKTSVSRLVDNLLKSGLISREVGQDRRVYHLSLSSTGRELLEKSWPLVQAKFPWLFSSLSWADQSTLLRLLLKVRTGLGDLPSE